MGLKLKKVHRTLQFKQKAFLAEYINYNTEQRGKAKNEFEKSFYKLMNNSVYGKTLQNSRNYSNIKFASNWETFSKYSYLPTFKYCSHFGGDFMAIHLEKDEVTLNQPIQVGFTVLEYSKLHMFHAHYNLKNHYGNKLKLLMTDTDSLVYQVETEDIYKDIKENINDYDTSNYPSFHELYSKKNKAVLKKMKDEYGGKIMTEFCGLRSKMYSHYAQDYSEGMYIAHHYFPVHWFEENSNADDNINNRCKGIIKKVVKKFNLDTYKDCLMSGKSPEPVQMETFACKNHNIYTQLQNKNALCAYDDKTYILDDGIRTHSYGHYRINN